MKTTVYNTAATSENVEVLNNVVKRCPYECVELEPGKYGFMDNENGDVRNYFCDTLGYECSNYESFDFEYFDEPQTVNDNKPSFYTSNGWEGSKYDDKKGAKEVAKELRAYIKANPDLNACKWSIRSTWGMYADSLFISLMAAPFDPFSNEYKERHEYRYNRGYSEHGTIEDYTTPKAYNLMIKVKAFVMQYIHDDSDGMMDYFDRNIYDHYEIGKYDKPFQLIDKKESPKQGEPSGEPAPGASGFDIVDYSEKAIAVFGETKVVKDELKMIGGKFNSALKYNGEKRAGWIFSKKQADKVREFLMPDIENITIPSSEKTEPIEKEEFTKASDEFIEEWRKNNPYPGSKGLNAFNAKFNRDYSEFAERWLKPDERGVISYLIPNPYPFRQGEYKETELDKQKKEADILLKSIDGNFYTLRLNKQIDLKSKRIKRYDNGCIAVPQSIYNKLEAKYNIMCDF